MNQTQMTIQQPGDASASLPASSLALQQTIGPSATRALQQMFRDPRVLEPSERGDLISSLSKAVEVFPSVPEVRVMLGMALCVDLRVQEAMTKLREAVDQDPQCYIAQLKLGELMMRLRICDKAADHTRQAAKLAASDLQADLARKQAASIRVMQREGIERGGYGGVLAWAKNFTSRRSSQPRQTALAVSE